jgi:hypothetical protein
MRITKYYIQVWKLRIQWICPESEITNKHWMFEVSFMGRYAGYYEDGFYHGQR